MRVSYRLVVGEEEGDGGGNEAIMLLLLIGHFPRTTPNENVNCVDVFSVDAATHQLDAYRHRAHILTWLEE